MGARVVQNSTMPACPHAAAGMVHTNMLDQNHAKMGVTPSRACIHVYILPFGWGNTPYTIAACHQSALMPLS